MDTKPIALHPEWVWTEEGPCSGKSVLLHPSGIVEVAERERHPHGEALPRTLLLPGFVNAHSHAFQRAFRGHVQWKATAEDDFWTWRDRMYAAANGLPPEGVEAVSRLAFLEMAEAGFTAVGEFHYLHHAPDGARYADPDELARRVIAAARDVGLRIALLRVVYGAGGIGRPLGPTQRRFATRDPADALAAVERLSRIDDPHVTVGLAPHSVRAVPHAWLPELASFGGVVHAHVSEQPGEVADCLAATGRTPLEVFDAAGLVGSRFTAVHLTHPTDAELDRMRASGARIAVCPTTELDLGDGFLPLAARDGIGLCVGTDSQARIDGFAEARALELHARGLARRRCVMAPPGSRHGLAERLLHALTTEGARALGIAGGPVRTGAPADLVAIDLDRPGADGVPPLEATVFNGAPDWVRDVWVGGRRIIQGGLHPRRDAIRRAAAPWLG